MLNRSVKHESNEMGEKKKVMPEGNRVKTKVKKTHLYLSIHTDISEGVLVIQKLRQEFPPAILPEITQLPRATFYYHLKQMNRPDKYEAATAV